MSNPQSAIRNPKSNGFTLVEIVITIVLVSVIAAIAAMIILQGIQGYVSEASRSDVYYQARLAMERMAREIRLIRSPADITSLSNTNLQYTDVNNSIAGFNWTAPTLYRWNGAGSDVLASGITAFSFSYLQQDGVTAAATAAAVRYVDISLTAQQGAESLVMRSRVRPRNF